MPIRLKYGGGSGYRGVRTGMGGPGIASLAQLGIWQQNQDWQNRQAMQETDWQNRREMQAEDWRNRQEMQQSGFSFQEKYARSRFGERTLRDQMLQGWRRRDMLADKTKGKLQLDQSQEIALEKAKQNLDELEKQWRNQQAHGGGDYTDYLNRKRLLHDEIDSILAKGYQPLSPEEMMKQRVVGWTKEEYPGSYPLQGGGVGQLVSETQRKQMLEAQQQQQLQEARAALMEKRAALIADLKSSNEGMSTEEAITEANKILGISRDMYGNAWGP